MPSSRRPSSTHSQTPPSTWRRGLSVANKSPEPPSVSMLFAQSEQDSGLGSAATRLTSTHIPLSSSPLRDEVPSSSSGLTQMEGIDAVETASLSPSVRPKRERTMSSSTSRSGYRLPAGMLVADVTASSEVSKENIETMSLHDGKSGKERSWFTSIGRKRARTLARPSANEVVQVGEDTTTNSIATEVNATSNGAQPTSTGPIAFPSSNDEPDSPPRVLIPPRPVRRSLWFTSASPTTSSPMNSATSQTKPAPSASGSTTPTPRPTHKHTDSALSIPSSIDEEVPPPHLLPQPALSLANTSTSSSSTESTAGTGLLDAELTSNTHANPASKYAMLNPSTSRFTLSLPLLGRAKMPLEQAVAQAEATTSIAFQEVPSGNAPETATSAPPVIEPTPTSTAVANGAPSSSETLLGSSSANWSYWDYLGYKSNSEPGPIQLSAQDPQPSRAAEWEGYATPPSVPTRDPPSEPAPLTDAEVDVAVEKDATIRQSKSNPNLTVAPSWSYWDYIGLGGSTTASGAQPEPAAPTTSSAPPTIAEPPHAEDTQQQQQQQETNGRPPVQQPPVADPPVRAKSIFSQDTYVSYLYSPLSYLIGSSTPTPAPAPPSAQGVPAKTEAELVKEEALARDDPPTPTPQAPAIDPPAPKQDGAGLGSIVGNPIESSVAANKTGWTSFFASRAVSVKRVTENGEPEAAVEEMDLDDEGEALGRVGATPAPAPAVATKNIPIANAKVRAVAKSPLAKSPAATAPSSVKTAGLAREVVDPKGKVVTSKKAEKSRTPSRPATPSEPDQPPVKPTVEKERPKKGPPVPPLTDSDTVRRKVAGGAVDKRGTSPAPSKKSVPPSPRPPNLVLPSFEDTFYGAPRGIAPPTRSSTLSKAVRAVSGMLFSDGGKGSSGSSSAPAVKGKGKAVQEVARYLGKELPRAWSVAEPPKGTNASLDVRRGCKRVCIIGIHGWFPGAIVRTMLGEPTGTSVKFANMMKQALEEFQAEHHVEFEKITQIPLEGEGTIEHRVEKLYTSLTTNEDWMDDLHHADIIFVATHSQGSIVSTHILARLIEDDHIRTIRTRDAMAATAATIAPGATGVPAPMPIQRVCCLALCGIHLGPLPYLHTSSLLQPYLQYFESAAATQLFEFQDTTSVVSKKYTDAVQSCLNHGIKFVYVASLNDQVVPIYSGAFASISHPLILRALYIDGDAYHSSDFLSNLLVLLLRIRNAGLSDEGLLAHLSEATAGSLRDVGHSTAYEELANYSMAVKYTLLVNNGLEDGSAFINEAFDARSARNDYEIPWALRELIADERVFHLFSDEFKELRDSFDEWHPRTAAMKEIKRKLQPIQRLSFPESSTVSSSKL